MMMFQKFSRSSRYPPTSPLTPLQTVQWRTATLGRWFGTPEAKASAYIFQKSLLKQGRCEPARINRVHFSVWRHRQPQFLIQLSALELQTARGKLPPRLTLRHRLIRGRLEGVAFLSPAGC